MNRFLHLFSPRDPQADATGVLVPAVVLVAIGLLCVYSFGAGHWERQAAWALLAAAVCFAVSRVPLRLLRDAAGPLLAGVGFLLLAALLFTPKVEGTHRWFVIPFVGSFQPSELAKIAVVLFLAARLSDGGPESRSLKVAWPVGVICLLVLPAPDFGTTIFLAAVAGTMLLIGGVRMGRLLAAGAVAVVLLLVVGSHFPYVAQRLRFFQGVKSYQQVQAELALGSGGFLGKGLGAGVQKLGFLPAGHTDFVFPNVGEEMGFVGVFLVGLLFAMLLVHGGRIALAAMKRKDRFAFHVACGATFVVVAQAVLNIAVSTGAAPTKGISLPFLSQGGSNLLASMIAVGLVVNVGRSLEKGASQ